MYSKDEVSRPSKRHAGRGPTMSLIALVVLSTVLFQSYRFLGSSNHAILYQHEAEAYEAGLAQCLAMDSKPDTMISAGRRNTRFEHDTKSTLLRNASLIDGDGTITFRSNILMENGIFTRITDLAADEFHDLKDVLVYDVEGRFVTPGLVDMHSHAGVSALPAFQGTDDTNEIASPVTSQMRSIDGLDLDDVMLQRVLSGGVTSSLILPGSANVIGGEAFAIKLSAKKSLTIEDYLVQYGVEGKRQRWMKMACGENPKRVYPKQTNTRMGVAWSFRHRFDQARTLMQKQDAWCEKAGTGPLSVRGESFPSDLELESMVGVLRGDVQINNHCYNKQDFEMQIKNSREFGFEIGAFHHAHDAYRVPEMIKEAPGNITIAIFATLWGYKREAFNGSPYAGKILSDANIPVAYKSDHPVTNSQHLIYQSQLATHFDLSDQLAIKAVTSVPATSLGLGHRIGYVRPGYDADLVLWDRYPLTLGSHPIQVFVDGKPQLELFHEDLMSASQAPAEPEEGVVAGGLTDSTACQPESKNFVITGLKKDLTAQAVVESTDTSELTLVVEDGEMTCFDVESACRSVSIQAIESGAKEIHVENGFIAAAISAVTPNLGLGEIDAEPSTQDGVVDISKPLDPSSVIKAIDGLTFGGPHSDRAIKMGVNTAITAPGSLAGAPGTSGDFLQGVSVAFRLSGSSVLDAEAIIKQEVALHFFVGDGSKGASGSGSESVSTQIKTLRSIFSTNTTEDNVYARAAGGSLPVVIDAHNSDDIAHLILLKREFPNVYMVLKGGTEAFVHAKTLAKENIPVLALPRCLPSDWRSRKCLPGPPMSQDTGLSILLKEKVKVALISADDGAAGELYWEAAWAAKLANESSEEVLLTDAQTIDLVSKNVREILRLPEAKGSDFVVFSGNPLKVKSQIALSVEDGTIRNCLPRVS